METFLAVSIILGYCIGMWVIGAVAGRHQQRSVEDYFLASRTLGFIVLSTGMLATWGSAWSYLGNVGMYYTHGLAYIVQIPFNLLFIHIFYKFGVRTWKLGSHFHFVTPGDMFEDFYESRSVSILVTLVLVVFSIPFMTIQMMASGYMFEVGTKGAVPFWAGALILCGTIAFYSFAGGKRASMWTNVVQCVLMLAGMVLAGWALVSKFGGITGMFENVAKQVPALMTVPGPIKAWHYQLWISYTIAVVLGSLCAPHMIANMFVAKNPKIFKWSMAILAFPAFYAIPILFMGMGGRLDFPGLKGTQADYLLPSLLMKYFPLWFASFVMAGGMAAAMSTVDQLVIASSASITRNIYPKSFKDSSPERQVRAGRGWVLVLCLAAWLLAITKPAMITMLGIWVTGCWMQIGPAFLGILYWHRATRWGAFWGILTGSAVTILFTVLPPPFRNPLGFMSGFWGLLANIVVFYLISVFTRPPSEETCERFRSVMLRTVES